jgi:endonuclease III
MHHKHLSSVFSYLESFFNASNDPHKNIEDHDPFRLLIGTIISLRTKSAITAAAADRLFALAPTAKAMLRLDEQTIADAIYPAGFYAQKAVTIKNISQRIMDEFGGKVPANFDALLSMKGVGRKTANFVVTMAFGLPGICVDVHVHRIANRWGLVQTKTPDATEMALRKHLPTQYWLPINGWLVLFGQQVCKPVNPQCSSCGINRFCQRVGVDKQQTEA